MLYVKSSNYAALSQQSTNDFFHTLEFRAIKVIHVPADVLNNY